MINIRDYGARGNGVIDDTDAIRSALQRSAGLVYFPAGVYKVTGQLSVPRNVHVRGDGVDATTVTAVGALPNCFPNHSVFYFAGDGFTQFPCLEADVAHFSTIMHLKSTEGVQADDVIVLIKQTDGSYSTHRPYYNAGEYLQINELLAPGVIGVVGGLQADYAAGSTQVYRLTNPTRSSIAGMTVVGTECTEAGNPYCIGFRYGRGIAIRDVRVIGAQHTLCQIRQCFGALVDNLEGDQLFASASLDPDLPGYYGVMVANSQDVRVTNSRISAIRHALAIGGASGGTGNPNPVNRQIVVSNCDLKVTCNDKSRTVQALDAHGNCESYTFANNRVHGGIEFGGRLGRIIGNDIYGRDAEQTAIGLLATEWKGTEFELRNNRIYTKTTESFDEGGDKRGAIFLHTNEKTVIGGATIVANNAIHVAGDFGQYRGLRAVNNKSTVKWTLIVDNNDFYAETPGYLLSIKKMAGARIAALIIRNNTFRNGAIEIAEDAVEELVFRGNWPLPDR